MLLPKLISMNSLNFDFVECGFSEKMMNVKDKKDGLSREGCGRVAIYKDTDLPHCYTLECNYANGRRINHLAPKLNKTTGNVESETKVTDCHSKMYTENKVPHYNIEIFEDVGRAFCIGLLDYVEKNPISRINMSTYKTLESIKNDILNHNPIILP
jgi:cytosolic carboxypeptidase protein 5